MATQQQRKTRIKVWDPAGLDRLPARLRPISDPIDYPTPAEIVEAKLDGFCPRCGDFIDFDGFSGLCHSCNFSF